MCLCDSDLSWNLTFSQEENQAYLDAIKELKCLEELGFDE